MMDYISLNFDEKEVCKYVPFFDPLDLKPHCTVYKCT
jgi:hypothetical protein